MESVGQLPGHRTTSNNVLSAIMMRRFYCNAHKPTDSVVPGHHAIKQNANRAAALVRSCWRSRASRRCVRGAHLGETLGDLGMLLKRLIGEKVTLDVVHAAICGR